MLASVLFFLVGWGVVFVLTPSIIRLGVGIDVSDEFRKKHDGKISRLGGIPLFVAFLIGNLGLYIGQAKMGPGWGAMVCCTSLMFGIGLWDDFKPLGARVKLAGQILVAVIAYSLGLSIDTLTYPGGNFILTLGWWSLPFTVLWLIAIPNIVNLIDGFDGLASGIGVFLSVTLGVVALSSEQVAVAAVCFALAGSLLAFLSYNFPPAKIFLGDGGAYMIGFLIAALSLQSSNKGSVAAALIVTIVALGVPILDTTLTLFRRGVQGFPLFRADRGHLHHRLEELGFSKTRIVLSLYGACVVLSLIGLSILWSQGRTLPIAAGMLFLLALVAVRSLGYFRTWWDLKILLSRMWRRRRDVQYGILQGKVLELEVERCRTAPEFWRLFFHTLEKAHLFRQPPVGAGKILELTIERRNGTVLAFYVRLGDRDENYWQHLVDCFKPSCHKADEKWPEDPSSTI